MLNELLRFVAGCLGVMVIYLATDYYISNEYVSTVVFIIASLIWYVLVSIQHTKLQKE